MSKVLGAAREDAAAGGYVWVDLPGVGTLAREQEALRRAFEQALAPKVGDRVRVTDEKWGEYDRPYFSREGVVLSSGRHGPGCSVNHGRECPFVWAWDDLEIIEKGPGWVE
jgi:hypothetical protein